MTALLFSPHNDDETLFAFYQLLRHKPHVVVVLRSYKQWTQQNGPTYQHREVETGEAMKIAGCTWDQWTFSDLDPQWDEIADAIKAEVEDRNPNVLIGPAWEMGGHEDHNAVASILNGLGGYDLVEYLTYQRGYGRSMNGEVVEGTPEEADLKLAALQCYQSQWEHEQTKPWFPGGDYSDVREWVVG